MGTHTRAASFFREIQKARRSLEEPRRLRRPPNDHNFGSLLVLAVTVGAFLFVTWIATKGLLFFLQASPIR
jgi:hypothetical protein